MFTLCESLSLSFRCKHIHHFNTSHSSAHKGTTNSLKSHSASIQPSMDMDTSAKTINTQIDIKVAELAELADGEARYSRGRRCCPRRRSRGCAQLRSSRRCRRHSHRRSDRVRRGDAAGGGGTDGSCRRRAAAIGTSGHRRTIACYDAEQTCHFRVRASGDSRAPVAPRGGAADRCRPSRPSALRPRRGHAPSCGPL